MLYYPHYTPSPERLRSMLLLFDQVSLIVPLEDQAGVQRRGHICELLERDELLIDFKDPTFRYSGWIEKPGVAESTLNLISDIVSETSDEGDLSPVRLNQHGVVERGQDEEIAYRWTRRGWKYVAAQKFPHGFEDLFFSDGMALRVGHFCDPVTGEIIEHNGVLCHPKLADFVLSRMAREAAHVEGLPSMTFGKVDYANHLYDGTEAIRVNPYRLLEATIDLLVPNDLMSCDVPDYLGIREEYSSIRRDVWNYLRTVSFLKHLDSSTQDPTLIAHRLEEAREHIGSELGRIRRQLGRERFTTGTIFTIQAATTVGLAAIGAELGGAAAAAATSGLAFAISSGATKVSTLGRSQDGELRSIAMTLGKIEKRNVPARRAMPRYLI